jgi:PIN domain nuclease of toxin-antitoxin system
VSLLLDTHALLWWLSDDVALKLEARKAISDPSTIILCKRSRGVGNQH